MASSVPPRQAAPLPSGVDAAPGSGRVDRAARGSWQDPAAAAFMEARARHWDRVAAESGTWKGWGGAYHARLEEVYRFVVPPGLRVLEVGCGLGDLLAAVAPATGIGVDISPEMISCAAARHPGLKFVCGDAHDLPLDETFDVVILSDLINELWDVERVFEQVRRLCHGRSRLVINTYNRLWDWPLRAVRGLGLARPMLDQNWLTLGDTANLLTLAGFEPLRSWHEVLWPLRTPLIAPFFNRVVTRLPPLDRLALGGFIVARPAPAGEPPAAPPRVSVIVPARNEAGNIGAILERTPQMGAGTELVFVEGHSTDGTFEAIRDRIAPHADRPWLLLRQEGRGKGDAVRLGLSRATGGVLMILDADLTVAPEDLPRFYDALVRGRAEFVNGVRLVYPMERRAMRFLNLVGNTFFSGAFSWLLGQRVKDTLCGTKALFASDYRRIAAGRADFGDFDPFGDFDLLFGASRLSLKIVDLPIRYRERTYGQTNIHRFRHGWLLLEMLWFGAWRLKFR
jgi:SAM-dependent methyltransferase